MKLLSFALLGCFLPASLFCLTLQPIQSWQAAWPATQGAVFARGSSGRVTLQALLGPDGIRFLDERGRLRQSRLRRDPKSELLLFESQNSMALGLWEGRGGMGQLSIFRPDGSLAWSRPAYPPQDISGDAESAVCFSSYAADWGAGDGKIRFYRAASVSETAALPARFAGWCDAAFSENGAFCAALVSRPATLLLYDRHGGLLWSRPLGGGVPANLLVSPLGGSILVTLEDESRGESRVESYSYAGQLLWGLGGLPESLLAAFSENERLVALAEEGGQWLSLRDAESGKAYWARAGEGVEKSGACDLEVAPQGNWVAVADKGVGSGTVRVFSGRGEELGSVDAVGEPKLEVFGDSLFVLDEQGVRQYFGKP